MGKKAENTWDKVDHGRSGSRSQAEGKGRTYLRNLRKMGKLEALSKKKFLFRAPGVGSLGGVGARREDRKRWSISNSGGVKR